MTPAITIPKGTYPRYAPPLTEGGPEIRVEDAVEHEKKHPADHAKVMYDIANPPEKVTVESAVRKALDEQAASFREHLEQIERDHDKDMDVLRGRFGNELAAAREAAAKAPAADIVTKAVAAETKRCSEIVTQLAPVKVAKTITDAFYGIAAVKADDPPAQG